MTRLPLCLLAAMLAGTAPARAQHSGHDMAPPAAPSSSWTTLPLVQVNGRGANGAEITTANGAPSVVTVVPPKGDSTAPALNGGIATFKPAVGNYHLVRSVETCEAHVATAVTAVYFANPGPAPTGILRQAAPDLTIMPERLPREHGAYRAGEDWRFVVRFNGQPFPGAKVRFETSNGTKTEFRSGLDGGVTVTFPDDFPPRNERPPEGHGRPTQAQFVIAAIDQTGAVQHLGAFNYTYRPGAFDGSSLWAGAGFAALGMIAAVPFLRRRAKGGCR